jgi:hypothetical protein
MLPHNDTVHGTLAYFFSPDDVISKISSLRNHEHTRHPGNIQAGVDIMGDSTSHWVESSQGRAVLLSHPDEYQFELYSCSSPNVYGDVEFVLTRGIHDSIWSGAEIPALDTPDVVQRFVYLTEVFYRN